MAKSTTDKTDKTPKGDTTMMTLDTKPTRQQLEDPNFWDNLPPDGVLYDGQEYGPLYSVLRDGKPIELKTDNGGKLFNSFHHAIAVEQAQQLAGKYENITIKVTGFYHCLIRADEHQTA